MQNLFASYFELMLHNLIANINKLFLLLVEASELSYTELALFGLPGFLAIAIFPRKYGYFDIPIRVASFYLSCFSLLGFLTGVIEIRKFYITFIILMLLVSALAMFRVILEFFTVHELTDQVRLDGRAETYGLDTRIKVLEGYLPGKLT